MADHHAHAKHNHGAVHTLQVPVIINAAGELNAAAQQCLEQTLRNAVRRTVPPRGSQKAWCEATARLPTQHHGTAILAEPVMLQDPIEREGQLQSMMQALSESFPGVGLVLFLHGGETAPHAAASLNLTMDQTALMISRWLGAYRG